MRIMEMTVKQVHEDLLKIDDYFIRSVFNYNDDVTKLEIREEFKKIIIQFYGLEAALNKGASNE